VFLHIHRQNNVDLAFVLYYRDRKKEFAPNYSAYYPFGVDVFLSPRKVDHIARFVELPSVSSSAKFPPILVVNVQVLILCLNLVTFLILFSTNVYTNILLLHILILFVLWISDSALPYDTFSR
jgi:hypothetical protein